MGLPQSRLAWRLALSFHFIQFSTVTQAPGRSPGLTRVGRIKSFVVILSAFRCGTLPPYTHM